MSTFRAIWPILDESVPYAAMLDAAHAEVPLLAKRAHARIVGVGRFWTAPSTAIPGSGRITRNVLVYDAPAVPVLRNVPEVTTCDRTYATNSHRACARCGIVREARASSVLCRDCRKIEEVA